MNKYLDDSCPRSVTYLATFYLIIMLTQFLPIEGYAGSMFKAVSMCLAPLLLLLQKKGNGFLKVLPYAGAYYLVLILCSLLFDEILWQRIIYRGLYVVMFIWFFCAVNRNAFTTKYFTAMMECFIIVNAVVIVLQQIAMLFFGTHDVPFINLCTNLFNRELVLPRANGLAVEPSHVGRILTVCYFAYIKVMEIVQNRNYTIKVLFNEHPYVTIAYCYSMLSIGSATALLGLILIFVYLLRRNPKVIIWFIPIIILLLNLDIEFSPLKRLNAVFNAFFSSDVNDAMRKNETSGFVRILPIINTLNLDIFSKEAWIGQGSATETNFYTMVFSDKTMVGDITNHGLIAYILSLIFVYKCCIRKFFSFETLLFFVLLGAGISSEYYRWGALMIFSVIKYFEMKSLEDEAISDNELNMDSNLKELTST